jgi:hypothetical protein
MTAPETLLLTDMDKSLFKDVAHMLVIQSVVDHFSLAAVSDESGLPEGPQLVGDGGLGHAQQRGNVADAHGRMLERAKYFDSGGIAEDFEEVGQVEEGFIVRHTGPDRGDHFLVDNVTIVPVKLDVFALHKNNS